MLGRCDHVSIMHAWPRPRTGPNGTLCQPARYREADDSLGRDESTVAYLAVSSLFRRVDEDGGSVDTIVGQV